MPTADSKSVQGKEIFTGARGGQYFITNNGRKVYLTKNKQRRNTVFKPRPGAYARFLASQIDNC